MRYDISKDWTKYYKVFYILPHLDIHIEYYPKELLGKEESSLDISISCGWLLWHCWIEIYSTIRNGERDD